MMFKKYNSLENTYRSEFIAKIREQGFADQQFFVQEKAHGANISYFTQNGTDFFAAKRTAQIYEGDKFNNFELVLDRIAPKLQAIWKELKEKTENLEQVTFFGEIIGGRYPHKEVPSIENAVKIQKGVFYGPDNYFYGFDIALNTSYYMNVADVNALFEKHGLLYAKTLFSGTLEECLQFPNDNDSIIPQELGLPPITPNISEGVVIRPEKTSFLYNRSRVLLKNKNEKWSEKLKSTKHKMPKTAIHIPEKVAVLREEILRYVTENRLNNVLSKEGEVSKKDFGKILGLFNKDVVTEFLKDHETELSGFDKKEIRLVTKSFLKASASLVNTYFNKEENV